MPDRDEYEETAQRGARIHHQSHGDIAASQSLAHDPRANDDDQKKRCARASAKSFCPALISNLYAA